MGIVLDILRGLGEKLRRHLALNGFMAMAAGVVVSNFVQLEALRYVIPVALFLMLYPSMLDVRPENMAAILAHPKLPAIALAMNFILSPLLIGGIGHLFQLHDNPSLLTGITLYATIPCGGMIAAFTVILRGNISLTVLITALSYLMSLILVPLWTKVLIGRIVPVSPFLILRHLFMIIIIPWIMADVTRRLAMRMRGEKGFHNIKNELMVLPGIGMVMLLFSIFVLNGQSVVAEPWLILRIVFPVGSFLVILILAATLISRMLQLSHADSTAMVMSTTAKNNAVAMALALSAFGTDVGMIIAFTGPMTQFPTMMTYLKIAQAKMKKDDRDSHKM